ncbi:glycoside hydrolase family 13 protein [Laccaria bicolor S238N-H82]|uniref:Glycoside hydrolase family 13 protein n=1 Tax=Laccaria bicolor (strain S238N-H82 / ATCC MYA-4686) TaxID=486041 RepID=B0DKP0_LACBS|nr:glycoside hydrolase family 13 protein [Laccaria bicolor S238N-H82]EDR04678.1 glycoside hydrolase family 13 protein [Laccaria bicolor S238N-H82]|eukprot:XP_001884502.1 glycoside hydrolase family 13 protein [Laccaria bicolor S238N-H82]
MSTPFVPSRAWWKEATIYQIFPISFFDSNGDGIGDLNGIYAKLDYLKDLGVDVLWLSPIYRSPLADMGYDISDFRDIDPRYGTLADWDNLLSGVHERGMKLMMDLVVNHTSDEHQWFLDSRSSKSDPKRDWYIWRPPRYDDDGNRQPPNNWRSVFQGSAWEYDEITEEYYLHLFVSKQPDLNWENADVRDAVWDFMQFWTDRGCDGFRLDVIDLLSKAEGLPDAPITSPDEVYQPAVIHYANGPKIHEYIKEMDKKVLSKYDLITVGEASFTQKMSEFDGYVLPSNNELNMVFHFQLMDVDFPKEGNSRLPLKHKDWTLAEFRQVVVKWQNYKREEGFWNTVYIENHDHARSVTRFGDDSEEWRAKSAKMLAILEISQSGTLYIYQGQELGLKNLPRTWGIEEYKDIASQIYYKKKKLLIDEAVDMSDILDGFQRNARDHARVPMQWNSSAHAGFTSGEPWMRVNEDYQTWNVAAQLKDNDSVHSFWKHALNLRKAHEVLIYGDFSDISNSHEEVFAYIRTLENSSALVLLNFKKTDVIFSLDSKSDWTGFRHVLGNYGGDEGDEIGVASGSNDIRLRGFEGRVYIQ